MNWFKRINSEALNDWFIARGSGGQLKQGQKLDPYVSSMRKLNNGHKDMDDLDQGKTLNGDATQKKADLSNMSLFDRQTDHLSIMGKAVLDRWNHFGIPNGDDKFEVHRSVILLQIALDLRIPAYIEYFEFWKKLRAFLSFNKLISSPELLYFFSYINVDEAGINPFKAIEAQHMSDADFSAINWNTIKTHYPSATSTAAIGKFETTISGYVSRQGRTNFCYGLELILHPEDADSIIAGLRAGIDKVLLQKILDEFRRNRNVIHNKIFFGAPGTGKSYEINKYANASNSVRITFHPDTDYASFVGSYKPSEDTAVAGRITYDFTAQQFLNAYLQAWKTLEPVYLVIEEINRGNCAQIFGDIFQLLERNEEGYSSYPIDVDTDLTKYLSNHFSAMITAGGDIASKAKRYIDYFKGQYGRISLPNNLFIHATMNTSDQSLFPMDSAFKRRWDWQYVPIDFTNSDAGDYKIQLGEKYYSWSEFVVLINEKIEVITESEDKKLGPFFVKTNNKIINLVSFRSKVLYYLWSDVLKDEVQTNDNYFFRTIKLDGTDHLAHPFTFNMLFKGDEKEQLQEFMKYLDIAPLP